MDGREAMTASPTPRKPRFPFFAKLAVFGVLLAGVPLVVSGWLVLDVARGHLETAQRELRIAVAEDVARTLDAEIRRAEDALDGVGRALTDPAVEESAAIAHATELVEASAAIDHASLYDASGALIDTIRERAAHGVPVGRVLDPALRARAERRGSAVGAATRAPGGPRALLVVPVRRGGTTTGWVATSMSLAAVQSRVVADAAGHFESSPQAVYVVDSQGHIVAHPDAEQADALVNALGRGMLWGVRSRKALAEMPAMSAAYTIDGVETVGSALSMPDSDWVVVVQVPRAVAYAPVVAMQRIGLVTLGVALALAVLLALLLAARVTRPIGQLARFARELAARRFDARIQIDTYDELSVLGAAMSDAAAELQESERRTREELAIRSDLGRYLPPEILDRVVRREQDMALGGVRREVTVLFADVVAFTPLTGKMPPERVVGLLNELFTLATEVVFRHGGTVDKFVGDCVMAVWGAVGDDPDQASKALLAAEDLLRFVEAANDGWQRKYDTRVQLAIGVSTGEAVVGNVGSERRMEFTAIGDTVNLAARLETIARPQQILLTARTHDAAGDAFKFRSLGPRTLTGRQEPVELFEVLPS